MRYQPTIGTNTEKLQQCKILVKGLVQGVGFRPFVYNLATKHALKGLVRNTTEGVEIFTQGTQKKIELFIQALKQNAPNIAQILNISVAKHKNRRFNTFSIEKSKQNSKSSTQISPDIAVCKDCLEDMKTQAHRINYPLINCTYCGPRFSIIKDIPYDRGNTTMSEFTMCPTCNKEYREPSDRRFHAQPVACNSCGPKYKLVQQYGICITFDDILETCARIIHSGGILCCKGLGGYHLICDARKPEAIAHIRKIKNRENKPFAVMCADIMEAKKYAWISASEEKLLTSHQRPIVLVREMQKLNKPINEGLNRIGLLLPYMPFHYLLFERLQTKTLLFTSANLSQEPVCSKVNEINQNILFDVNALITYNRKIYNRSDDSVLIEINNKPRFIRRSRGYTPNPIRTSFNLEGILATGAELKNCFCIGKNTDAILSQHIGDVKNMETFDFFEDSIQKFSKLFHFDCQTIACDLHPDYMTTKYAESQQIKTIKIQHHHAHIASCMAEHKLDEKVIGICFDGTGLGDDNAIWGGEFFLCDLESYDRFSHIKYMPMPGGDTCAKEPWRMALVYLYEAFGENIFTLNLPLFRSIDMKKAKDLVQLLRNNTFTLKTSSAGRLFDAAASIIGVSQHNTFEAEAPMKLESIIDTQCLKYYQFSCTPHLNTTEIIRQIAEDVMYGLSANIISAKFHNTLAHFILDISIKIRKNSGINKVVLSGGCFQNSYLLEKAVSLLEKNEFSVYTNEKAPANDGGVALGQIVIAAKQRCL